MVNLLRMDLYRMRKATSFWVCLGIALVVAIGQMPFAWLLTLLARTFSSEAAGLPASVTLSSLIRAPFPLFNGMVAMISACSFFYADEENGYIKNIAGQMPRRGFTVLSKFLAMIPHTLLYMAIGVGGNLIGTLFFARVQMGGDEAHALLIFLSKFLLMMSLNAILVTVVTSMRSKSLGSVLCVLLGTGLMFMIYGAINGGINEIFREAHFDLSEFMPDQLLQAADRYSFLRCFASAAVTTGIFLPLGIRIFDRRDVK